MIRQVRSAARLIDETRERRRFKETSIRRLDLRENSKRRPAGHVRSSARADSAEVCNDE